jgi:hypothetical protein
MTVSEPKPTRKRLGVLPVKIVEMPEPRPGMAPSRPYKVSVGVMELHLSEVESILGEPYFADRLID